MTLASIASTFSSPLVHSFTLFVLFKLLSHLYAKNKLLNGIAYLWLVWLLLCSMTYPSVLLIKPLEEQYPVVPIQSQQWRNSNAIVVLACNHFEDKGLPFVSRWPNCSMQRNLQAALMYQAHPLPIYLAGDILAKTDALPQAVHNRDFLIYMGIKPEHIFISPKGVNTETEVNALASLLKGKQVALVSSASHLPRAVNYFAEHNVSVLPIPVEHFSRINIEPVAGLPNAASLYRSERAIHEYLGLIYQRFVR
ncbi:YdcF family protein [Paraglaciecola aestuariivivens]